MIWGYLQHAQIGVILKDTLFVHGALEESALGFVPSRMTRWGSLIFLNMFNVCTVQSGTINGLLQTLLGGLSPKFLHMEVKHYPSKGLGYQMSILQISAWWIWTSQAELCLFCWSAADHQILFVLFLIFHTARYTNNTREQLRSLPGARILDDLHLWIDTLNQFSKDQVGLGKLVRDCWDGFFHDHNHRYQPFGIAKESILYI